MDFENSPKNGQIWPKSKEVNLNFLTILDDFWDFLKRLKKASLGLKKRFYLGLSFIGRIFLEKMDFENSPKNGQIWPKSKEVNLNFLTILDDFWDFFKKLKKASLGLKKRFYLGLSFIGSIFLEKMDFENSPKNGQIWPKSKEVNLNFLTILDDFWDFLKRLKKASLGL